MSTLATPSVCVQSYNVHPCIFVGPSLSSPAISVLGGNAANWSSDPQSFFVLTQVIILYSSAELNMLINNQRIMSYGNKQAEYKIDFFNVLFSWPVRSKIIIHDLFPKCNLSFFPNNVLVLCHCYYCMLLLPATVKVGPVASKPLSCRPHSERE